MWMFIHFLMNLQHKLLKTLFQLLKLDALILLVYVSHSDILLKAAAITRSKALMLLATRVIRALIAD